MQEWPVI